MSEPLVLYATDKKVATITLNRPEKRNATNPALYNALHSTILQALGDDNVRVIILTGNGPVFCAGQDLTFTLEASREEFKEYMKINLDTRELLRTMDKPVIAKINGDALGGGCYLATACDIIIAASHARFAMREILIGMHSGGAHLFTIGRARAMEINMTGRFISAAEAEKWGLINTVVAESELEKAVDDMANILASKPPLGLMYTKRATNFLLETAGFDALYKYIDETYDLLEKTEDRYEAKLAFTEKRLPIFKGK
jgi:enoyl-CoA hydratase/carnithine racemase